MNSIEQVAIWLAQYGMTFLLCDAKLAQKPRDWLTQRSTFLRDLLGCHFCSGFWVSLLVSMYLYWPPSSHQTVFWVLLYAFSGAAVCYAVDITMMWLESNTRNHQE